MPVDIIATLHQKNDAIFPIVEDLAFLGGMRTVPAEANLTDTTIPASYRKAGMLVYTVATDKLWVLQGDLLSWTEFTPGTAAISVLVYQPGGTAGGNVFTSWSSLCAEFAITPGVVWIYIDDSAGTPTISSNCDLEGRAYIMGRCDGARTPFLLAAGVTVQDPAYLTHLAINSPVDPGLGRIYVSGGSTVVFEDCSITTQTSGGGVLYVLASATVHFVDCVVTSGGAGNYLYQVGALHTLWLTGSTVVPDDVFYGTAEVELDVWLEGAWNTCSTTHTDYAGLLTIHEPPIGVSAVLIWEPYGTATKNVFTDWSLLYAAFQSTPGIVWIYFGDQAEAPALHIPVGPGPWDFENRAVFVAQAVGTKKPVDLEDGAIVKDPLEVHNIRLISSGDLEAGSWQISASKKAYFRNCQVSSVNTAAPCLQLYSASYTFFEDCVFSTPSGSELLVEVIGVCEMWLRGSTTIEDDVLNSSGLDVLDVWLQTSWNTCSNTQTGFLGTLNIHAPAAGGATSMFVFRPGYLGSASNVYATWAALYADFDAAEGPRIVQFDTTDNLGATITVPAGTYELDGATFEGRYSGETSRVVVELAEGAVLRNLGRLRNMLLKSAATLTAPLQFTGTILTPAEGHLVLDEGAILDSGTSAVALCSVTALQPLFVQLATGATLYGRGSALFSVAASAVLSIHTFGANLVKGPTLITADASSATGIYSHSRADKFNFAPGDIANVTIYDLSGKRERLAAIKGAGSTGETSPQVVGGVYVDRAELDVLSTYISLSIVAPRAKFRVVIESSSALPGEEAYVDLWDVSGVLNAGVPAQVSGSQIDTTTGVPPAGGPTPNPLYASAYEADVTAAFFGGGWTGPGAFEVRLWAGAVGPLVTCKSAELIFEW